MTDNESDAIIWKWAAIAIIGVCAAVAFGTWAESQGTSDETAAKLDALTKAVEAMKEGK